MSTVAADRSRSLNSRARVGGEQEFQFRSHVRQDQQLLRAERETNTNVISTAELWKWIAVQGLYSVSSSSLTVPKLMRLAWCPEPTTILTINFPASSPRANLAPSCKFCWSPNSESGSSLSLPGLISLLTSGSCRGATGTKQEEFANNFTSCRDKCSPHKYRQPRNREESLHCSLGSFHWQLWQKH